jgi:hypothetical protein
MTRSTSLLRASATLITALAAVALAGCTAQTATTPRTGTTAAPASEQRFACPTPEEVAALTAVPFTGKTTGTADCTYSADGASVVLKHPAGSASATLANLRYDEIGRGVRTADASGIAFDAFTSTTKQDCTVWFAAADGVASSVTAARSGASGTAACALARSVATLAGGETSSAAPTVAVLASTTLLGTTTADERWPWRIGAKAGVRIDRSTASGYLPGASSFAISAADVPADSAAVVFVSGTAEAGEPSLTLLRAATRALSAAATRAPKAELVVVGPVSDGTATYDELATLRTNLQAVAKIAGAKYIDPSTLTGSTATVLAGVADDVAAAIRR